MLTHASCAASPRGEGQLNRLPGWEVQSRARSAPLGAVAHCLRSRAMPPRKRTRVRRTTKRPSRARNSATRRSGRAPTAVDALARVRQDLAAHYPAELVDELMTTHRVLKENFLLSQHEPSELNGGKFVETCVRMIQHTTANTYTALGTPLKNVAGILRGFENLPTTSALESFRIHIPRVLLSIYNIRNKRGVGHVGGDVSANEVDSTLVATSADWVLAELFRIHFSMSLEDAQEIVDALVKRPVALVEELHNVGRVLLPTMSQGNQVLALLSASANGTMDVDELVQSVEPRNEGDFRNRVLRGLHDHRLIEYRPSGGTCTLTSRGHREVDRLYPAWHSELQALGNR